MKTATLVGLVIAASMLAAILWLYPQQVAATGYFGPVRVATYHGLLAAAALFAWQHGGGPERLAAAVVVGQAIADPALHAIQRALVVTDRAHLINDLGGFAALLAIALYSNRFWPMYMVALVGQPLLAHIADALDPQLVPQAYYGMQVGWSYLALIVLAIGVARHQRRGNDEADWSVP